MAEAVTGATRIGTALAVAERFFPAPTVAGIATGWAFPDALAGGTHTARFDGPVLLSDPERLPAAVAGYLAGRRDAWEVVFLYGGEHALGAAVHAQLELALGRTG